MNNVINTGIEDESTVSTPQPKKVDFLSKISDKIPPKLKELFAKFYSNKKIFWPVTIVFGLLFLVIILGLLFGSPSSPVVPAKKPTPSPFVQATSAPCASSDNLCLTGNKLRDLDSQINALDLKQSRLSPPEINYDIRF